MKIYFTIILFCLAKFVIATQTKLKVDNHPRITIKIDGTVITDSIQLFYNINYASSSAAGIAPKKPLKSLGDQYIVNATSNDKFYYISMLSSSTRIGQAFPFSDFIAEPNDDVTINYIKGIPVFSGNGSIKYAALDEIKRSEKEMLKSFRDSLKTTGYIAPTYKGIQDSTYYSTAPERLRNLGTYDLFKINYSLKILKKYHDRLSPFIFLIIKNEMAARGLSDFRRGFGLYSTETYEDENPKLKELIIGKLKVQFLSTVSVFESLIIEELKAYSSAYLNYVAIRSSGSEFDGVEWIKSSFTGLMRDRAVALLFVKYYSKINGVENKISNALQFVKNEDCYDAILEVFSNIKKGTPVYNFTLKNIDGKEIRLDDLRGKLVVMDFWFTGCAGCKTLAPHMKTIIDSLKTDSSIVFASVSIDKDIEVWKSSVKGLEYTSEGNLDLYTNGNGSDDPLIQYFKISYYPRIVIIDKKGNLVSANPARPVDKATENDFILLLKNIK